MPDFKVGDRVRVSERGGPDGWRGGWTGTITTIWADLRQAIVRRTGKRHGVMYLFDQLERIKEQDG